MGELPWSARASHLGGIPRRLVFTTVGVVSKIFTSFLNSTHVCNSDTLLKLVVSRPHGTPLVTVSNHLSTLDDPLMWGLRGMPLDPNLARWTLAADDICFTNPVFSYFFRLGKCIPLTRGAGIYQPNMKEALDRINEGEWLHTFPEGKISQENGPIRRLKWGVASLIARAAVPPIVLPIGHSGFEKVMPEKYWFGRRPLLPLCFKQIRIVVGEPIQFDIPRLKLKAEVSARKSSYGLSTVRNCSSVACTMHTSADAGAHQKKAVPGPDDSSMRWLYSHISDQLRTILQELVLKAKNWNRSVT